MSAPSGELGLFGKYRLLDSITTSRRASLYRAKLETVASSRLIALKCVSTRLGNDERLAGRFVRAAARSSLLKHSAACRIYEVGRSAGSLFVAMELVTGKDLGAVLARLRERGESVPKEIAAWITSQVAAALGAAQALSDRDDPGCHGDLEPSHVLIGYDGSVKLCGLGSSVTRAGAPMLRGRRAYQSPEIAAGATADVRSDVFSLGMCLHEMLNGQPMSDHVESTGVRMRRHNLTLLQGGDAEHGEPWTAERIAQRALVESPDGRWQRPTDMRLALEEFLAGAPAVTDSTIHQWMMRLFRGEAAHELKLVEELAAYSSDPEPQERPRRTSSGAPILPPPPPHGHSSEPPTHSMRVPRLPAEATEEPKPKRSDPDKTPTRGFVVQRMAEKMMVPPPPPPPPPDPPPPRPAKKAEPAWASDGRVYAFVPEPLPEEQQPARARWVEAAQDAAREAAQHKVLLIVAGASLLLGAGALVLWHANGLGARSSAPVETAALASVTAVTAGRAPGVASAEPSRPRRVEVLKPVELARPAASVTAKPQPARPSRRAPEHAAERPSSPPGQLASLRQSARAVDRSEERSAPRPASEPQPRQVASSQTYAPAPPRVAPAPLPSAKPVPTASAALDREPIAIKRTKPDFPARAKRMQIDRGRVIAELTIDRNGVVQGARIVDADPKGVFDEAVLKAVRGWAYKPRLKAGVPVEARGVRVTIQFVE